MAECAGLWIAEGDGKTKNEITFTNNCEALVKLFYNTISNIFPHGKFRLYVYTPDGKYGMKLRNCVIRVYTDTRASKPYYILRYANVKDVIKWRKIVSEILLQKKYYPDILRGFFAGEGNIKTGMHANRMIRIAQKNQIKIIDSILHHLSISYRFSISERSYVISGIWNWEKFYKYRLHDLHPDKKLKFMKTWKSYKEIHYPNNFIRNNILDKLSKPMTSRQLAQKFERTQATLQEILGKLKKEGKITNYKSRSNDYWVSKDSDLIVISDRKSQILKILEKPCTVAMIAKKLDVNWKAVRRRLNEMERLGLARQHNYLWERVPIEKEVIVI